MRKLAVACVVLLAVSAANAGPMTLWDTVVNTANNLSDPPTTSWFLPSGVTPGYTPPWYRYGFQDWGWNNGVAYLSDPSPDHSGVFSFVSGSLVVHAWGVSDEDPTLIYGDGNLLGPLQTQPPGLNTWTTTTFNLSPAFLQSWLTDGNLNSLMDIDTTWAGSGLIVDWATLTVTYRWDWREQPPVVPAPGAVVMAGLWRQPPGLAQETPVPLRRRLWNPTL